MAPTFLIGTFIYVFLGAVGFGTAQLWAGKRHAGMLCLWGCSSCSCLHTFFFHVTHTHTALARVLAITCAFCLWLSWALVYISQMNPLILPERSSAGD